jgi:heme peroxidase
VRPFRESYQDRYSRIFAPWPPPSNLDAYCEAVTALGTAMIDDGTRVSDDNPEILLDAGYTYFGQLVAHDLTKDISSVDEAWRNEPEQLQNLQTPKLDLEVLYGGGAERSPHLYEADGVRLKVGRTNSEMRSFDICVAANGKRLLADDRGAENLVLRQMTAVFARLHNFAIEQFRATVRPTSALFDRARRQTQHQFQYLVVHDYLRSVMDTAVYNRIFGEGRSDMEWDSFSIPIEFSAAAMRFGHAMVRPNYLFQFGKEVFLQEMLGKTTDSGSIDEELEINWGFFFQGAGHGSTVTSRPIDTRLAPPFQSLPSDLIGTPEMTCPFVRLGAHPPQLAVRTLMRGAGLRLASGQMAARAFNQPLLSEEALTTNSIGEETEQGGILREANLSSDTPLWYYILKEAEVLRNGNCLGPLGSCLVGETIHAALRADTESYLHDPAPAPPIWRLPEGSTQIRGFSELFRLANLL